MHLKLKNLEQLKKIVVAEKQNGKIIVFANGCFDILHPGHVRYLEAARAEGDLLIVALNSDPSIRRLKGEGRPILEERDRIILLSALECIDYLIVFEDDTVDRLLIELKPQIHCKGADYSPETVPERETVRSYGGSTNIIGGEKIQSTRWLIEEIQRKYS